MKRILIYIVLITAALWVPVRRADVAKLQPVQIVYLSREEDSVVLQTNTGDRGEGEDVLTALRNLKDTTPAVIYLDTAKYLLVTQEALADVEPLRGILKESVAVCRTEGAVNREDTAAFLSVHGHLPQLKHWKIGDNLPVLTGMNNRLIFSKKSEENT